MKHIIRFGTLEDKKDLTGLAETYDMIVFNANAITHSKDTIANFIIRNICVKENKNYYIEIKFKWKIRQIISTFFYGQPK